MTIVIAAATVIAGTVDTLPPADDRIYEAGRFGAGWLAAGIAAVAVAVAGLTWVLWPRRAAPIRAAAPQLVELRSRYLGHLDDLERQLLEHDITPRALHHELSRTLRRFAAEAGTTGATSMSAHDLDSAGLGHRRRRRPDVRASPVRGAAGERPMGGARHRQGSRRRQRTAPPEPGRSVVVTAVLQFRNPWLGLLAVAAVAAVAGVLWWRWRHPRDVPWHGTAPIANVDHARSSKVFARLRWRYRMLLGAELTVLSVAGIAAAVLAMRPLSEQARDRSTLNRDVMLCLDVSGSMKELDESILRQFIDIAAGLPGDRIGLTIWNGAAITVFPLTDDTELRRRHARVQPSISSTVALDRS